MRRSYATKLFWQERGNVDQLHQSNERAARMSLRVGEAQRLPVRRCPRTF